MNEELPELKNENKKCLKYITEIEKDKSDLLEYAQNLEYQLAYFKDKENQAINLKYPLDYNVEKPVYQRKYIENRFNTVKSNSQAQNHINFRN